MSRPAPERPGDSLPTPDDFAGWPPLGALDLGIECGPVPMFLDRLDARAREGVEDLGSLWEPDDTVMEHPEDEAVRLQFTRASRGPWLELRPGDRTRSVAWEEGGGLAWATHHAALLMDSAAQRGIVVLTDQDAAATARSVQNVVRVAAAWNAVVSERGLMLHASAVGLGDPRRQRDRCVLFLGESGAGKSTAARLSAPRRVHADDACLLLLEEQGTAGVFPSQPFAEPDFPGRWPANQRSDMRRGPRVAGIFRLRQAASHEVVPLRRAAASASILAHAPFLLDRMRPAALRMAERLADLPCAELRFAKNAGFWTEIDHFLQDARRPGDAT